jgi:hypothetical protein
MVNIGSFDSTKFYMLSINNSVLAMVFNKPLTKIELFLD